MGFGTPLETTFSLLSFGISSAVPENGYLMFMHCRCVGRKKNMFSIVSFIGVYGSKFTKFCTLAEHHGDYLP